MYGLFYSAFVLAQVPGLIKADNLELSVSTYVGQNKVTLYLSSDQQPFVFAFPGRHPLSISLTPYTHHAYEN